LDKPIWKSVGDTLGGTRGSDMNGEQAIWILIFIGGLVWFFIWNATLTIRQRLNRLEAAYTPAQLKQLEEHLELLEKFEQLTGVKYDGRFHDGSFERLATPQQRETFNEIMEKAGLDKRV
jgi:hypothetical protein